MIKLIVILIGVFLFSRPVCPADETNKTPAARVLPAASPASAAARRAMEGGQSATADKSPVSPVAAREATPKRESGQAETNEVGAVSGVRLRDPFWPIGFFPTSMPGGAFVPADEVDSARDKKTAVPAAGLSGMLRIGGIVRQGNKFYATVNGFTVQTGEVISVVAEGVVYKFVVEEIDLNKVQFRPIKR